MENRALILDGRIGEDEVAERSLELAGAWLAARDWEVTTLRLSELDVAPCLGCFGCWIITTLRGLSYVSAISDGSALH